MQKEQPDPLASIKIVRNWPAAARAGVPLRSAAGVAAQPAAKGVPLAAAAAPPSAAPAPAVAATPASGMAAVPGVGVVAIPAAAATPAAGPVRSLVASPAAAAIAPAGAAPVAAVKANAGVLGAFGSELKIKPPKAWVAGARRRIDAFPPAARWAAVILVTVAATAAAMWALQQRPGAPANATLTVQTTPPGAEVSISGKPSGISPVSVSLPPGEYQVVLTGTNGQRRELAVTLTAAGSVVQHVEMGAAAAAGAPPAARTGALHVETDPAGQTVMVDGTPRGVTPLTVPSLAPGEHAVVVRGPAGVVRRTVVVQRGETMSLVLAPTAAPAATGAGWVTFDSPIVLQLRENGQLVGTTETARLMLTAGEHQLEMSNDALGFSVVRRVSVTADRTTNLAVTVPNGTLSINAVPWAEVFIAGERIGETPIANIARPIGTHEVVLRHPQLGERRATVTVSTRQTARLGVDMRSR